MEQALSHSTRSSLYGGANTNKVGTDPIPQFTAPDRVFVTSNGPVVIEAPSHTTIGRYAFAVYNEGGLLDINIAGYPQSTTTAQSGPKGLLSFADLRQVFGTTSSARNQIDNLVPWPKLRLRAGQWNFSKSDVRSVELF